MAEHRLLVDGGRLQVAFATGTDDGSGRSWGKLTSPDAALFVCGHVLVLRVAERPDFIALDYAALILRRVLS